MIERYTYQQLTKLGKSDMTGLPGYRLALLGDCATQHLSAALRGCAFTQGFALDVYDADYDQINAQVTDAQSEMYAYKPDAVLIHMCTEKLYKRWQVTSNDGRASFAGTEFENIINIWNRINQMSNARVLQFNFPPHDDRVFGNFACSLKTSFTYQLRRLNMMMAENCPPGVSLIDMCYLASHLGTVTFRDPRLYYIAKMPVSVTALPAVAAEVIKVVQALRGCIKKCVVLDLDNTLWGGVIGDDGVSGIQIGQLGTGPAFSDFQSLLAELKKRGVLLAVCSKNEEPAAREPFEKHDEMVLRLDDFAVFIANWEDKAANIRHIAQTLNIGLDSIVFIDDNPFERELVRSLIPEVTVPEMPEDPAMYTSYLQNLNLFETASYSDEDALRTEHYRSAAIAGKMQSQFDNYDEYLQSLEMTATAAPFDALRAPRIAQLTQRSNQFNLRTVRYTQDEIEDIMNDPEKITLYFTLKDKFTDHGLISVVILDKYGYDDISGGKTFFIDTWLMSCRVLKRGMEEFIVNKIISTAREHGADAVTGEYIETAKNAMTADIYETLGFTRSDTDTGGRKLFTAHTGNFKYNSTFIKEQGSDANDT